MSSRFFWPIFLIVAGVLFMLDNFGLLPGSAWGWIWPLLLVSVGVNLLLRWNRRRPAATGSPLWSGGAVNDSLPLDGATSAQIVLRHGAGRLTVRAGGDPAVLFAGTFDGGLDKQVYRSGDRIEVTLRSDPPGWGPWMWPGEFGRGGLDWEMSLNPNISLSLSLETGASNCDLDLSALRVTDLALKTGASATDITLPAQAGFTRVRIAAGAAAVRVKVPDGVAARIRGRMGLGALNVDQSRFSRRDGTYESSGFESATNRAELEIDGGVGEVSVR
ncbi:MAG: hypothetical protein HY260_21990 [Chloroflexi bacterium]|nr:hypothetical protein [Chloroflexota bacterium]